MKKNQHRPVSYLAKIMRPHAKPEGIQQRQSALLMSFADEKHEKVAALLKTWLEQAEQKSDPQR
jgi:hypothetical protein